MTFVTLNLAKTSLDDNDMSFKAVGLNGSLAKAIFQPDSKISSLVSRATIPEEVASSSESDNLRDVVFPLFVAAIGFVILGLFYNLLFFIGVLAISVAAVVCYDEGKSTKREAEEATHGIEDNLLVNSKFPEPEKLAFIRGYSNL